MLNFSLIAIEECTFGWWEAREKPDTRGKVFIKTQRRKKIYLVGYSLSGCLIWGSLIGCLWQVVLKLHFLGFKHIDSDLSFGLLTQDTKALESPCKLSSVISYFNTPYSLSVQNQ